MFVVRVARMERPTETSTPNSPHARRLLALAASLAFAFGCAWIMRVGGLPVVPDASSLSVLTTRSVVLFLVLHAASLYLRAFRWTWLLEPIAKVPLRRVVAISFIGYGALVLLPFRMGEAARPLLIRKRGLSAWAAFGTIAAERIVDGLVLSALLFGGLLLAVPNDPLPDHIGNLQVSAAAVPRAAYLALMVFVAAFVTIGVFWRARVWARQFTRSTVGRFAPNLAEKLADTIDHVASGLGFFPRLRLTMSFVVATVAYFLLNTWAMQILLVDVGLEGASFVRALVVVGVLHIGALLPNAPGYFGTFQLSLYAALALYFAPSDVMGRGAVVVFVTYVVQIGLAILLAAVALVFETVAPKEHEPAPSDLPESSGQ